MSTSKGNVSRSRRQKYQNRTAFKNDLHDTSNRTKFINSIRPAGVCARCKEILEWKIKYKKYKPLTAPSTCVKCSQKTVKHAYHAMCGACAREHGACAKCCKKTEVVENKDVSTPAEDEEFKQILKSLPERKRRTLLRYLSKQKENANKEDLDPDKEKPKENKCGDDLTDKINKLKLIAEKNKDDEDSDFDDSDFDSSDFSDGDEP